MKLTKDGESNIVLVEETPSDVLDTKFNLFFTVEQYLSLFM